MENISINQNQMEKFLQETGENEEKLFADNSTTLNMERNNDRIQMVCKFRGKKDRKIINVYIGKKSNDWRMLEVPADAPEIDPYDTKTGRGFMTPNAIMKSGLSANAKLLFTALRSYICYNLGVVFPREEQLRERMSKDVKSIRKAVKELERYGVIKTVKMYRNRSLKKYYYLQPENQWRLPIPDKYAYRPEERGVEIELLEEWEDNKNAQTSRTVQNDLMSTHCFGSTTTEQIPL